VLAQLSADNDLFMSYCSGPVARKNERIQSTVIVRDIISMQTATVLKLLYCVCMVCYNNVMPWAERTVYDILEKCHRILNVCPMHEASNHENQLGRS